MKTKITFKSNSLTLVGRSIQEGGIAANFLLTSVDLEQVTLDTFNDKVKIFTTFPSLDTPVCDLQVKEFNKQAVSFASDVVVVGISKDLPFAQKRFCQENTINNVQTVSDYKTGSFGINYGLLIKELNLLARSVLIVDKSNVIRYIQIVSEVTNAPDYGAVIEKLKEITHAPTSSVSSKTRDRCIPCTAGTPALNDAAVKKCMQPLSGWELIDNKTIRKTVSFEDFVEAKYFVDVLSVIAQEQGHHPTITIMYNKVKIALSTHASGGLTDNDFIMAKIIDDISRNGF